MALSGGSWDRPGMALSGGKSAVITTQTAQEKETTIHEQPDHGFTSCDEAEYPGGVKLFVIMLSLGVSVFLVALHNTIIGTAIPKITDRFEALDDVGWYGSAYLFTLCAFQLLFGKLYTVFSIKWVYLAAIVIFEGGSAICGAAPTSVALIIGRAIAGIGAAGSFSGGLIIIAHSAPLAKRPMYTGLLGASWGIAAVAGPLLGGLLTDRVSWRWCFYINLPLGALVLVAMFFTFNPPRHHKRDTASLRWRQIVHRLDPWGTLTFIPGVVCCLLALQWGGSKYAWNNARIIVLFTLSGILHAVFVVIQVRVGDNATVPLRIIKQRSIIASIWFTTCLGCLTYTFVYLLPIWFLAIKGASPWKSGVMIIPFLLGLILMSIVVGTWITVSGYYVPPTILGSILMSIGAGLLTTLQTDSGPARWIGYQVLFGCGLGMATQTLLIATQTVLKLQDVPTGTSLMMFMQALAGSVFLAAADNIFVNRLMRGLAKIPGVDPSVVLAAGATNLKLSPAIKEAYNKALTQTWYLPVALAAFSILGAGALEWRSVKAKKEVDGGDKAVQLDSS